MSTQMEDIKTDVLYISNGFACPKFQVKCTCKRTGLIVKCSFFKSQHKCLAMCCKYIAANRSENLAND